MKTFIVALSLLMATVCSGQSMDNYYWYFDKKIPIETAPYDVLLISNDEMYLEDVRKWTLERQTVVGVQTTSYKALRLQLQPDLITRTAFIESLQKTFPRLMISPSIIYQGSTIGVLNQIVLKPVGKDAQAVIQRFGSAIKLLKASKYNTYLFEIASTSNCVNLANRIQESGLVEFCQPNFIGGIKLSNPLYPDQYYLNNTGQFGGTTGIDINAPEAWNITQGCNNVRVAVIDQGVADHDDMAGRVANGFDPLFPANPGRPLNADDNHGTPCAGIIGAGNNNIGIRGIASNAIIVPVKIFNGDAVYATGDIADAINWAWDDGAADILSNSWGGPNPDAAITTAINNALTLGRGGLGCIVVAAAGNQWPARNLVDFPARINNVIAVGAIDRNGNLWGYSQRGNGMDLVAPTGNTNQTGDVRTTDRPGADGYDTGDYTNEFGGTSAACPQVAGVAALMLSANPSLTEAQVRTFLQQTATDMGAGGYDTDFGFGRVNAEAAVKRALGNSINGPGLICTSGTFSLNQLIPGTVNWSTSNSGILVIDGNGIATRVGNYNGFVDIIASIANGCGSIRRTVYVGAPAFSHFTVNNQQTSYATICTGGSDVNIQQFPFNPNVSYNWSITYGNPNNAYLTSQNNTATFLTYSPECFGVGVQMTNVCGTTNASVGICAHNCFSRYTVSPNPSKDYVSIRFEEVDNADALPDQINLLSEKSTVPVRTVDVQEMASQKSFKTENSVEINVADLPRGTYYLHIRNSRREDKQVDIIRLLLE